VTRQTNQLGDVTSCQYDGDGNLTRETDPLGQVISYAYNLLGQVTQEDDANNHNGDNDTSSCVHPPIASRFAWPTLIVPFDNECRFAPKRCRDIGIRAIAGYLSTCG
jgi:YD repeat-containing protein